MSFTLPDLNYSYNDLEPFFDRETMKIHHTKHHQAYIDNSNNIIKLFPNISNISIEKIIKNLDVVPSSHRLILRNNLGGHFNHSFFWKTLEKNKKPINKSFENIINSYFGSFDKFKEIFEDTGMKHFGSGWVWLIKNKNNKLSIVSTLNQDNPIMGVNVCKSFGYPLLGLDLWEHAYYLKYQNRRKEYIQAFWNLVNWDIVYDRFLNNK
ncbi:sodA [Wigglesworthia glossinidia endosymbiont of Glossina brevipalpis]|uniref:Superoxide dismutase n=1 Tax=Wigglesworthia glossinidia brevipalpis TaxID=36870 RepID=Q8D1W1_WIGBR|nr:sodA [Wigglesworthia glossinidia endosymbiont of Glossina brevipalpis]